MSIFNSKVAIGGLLTGTLVTGTLLYTGQVNLDNVQSKFDTLKGWYVNAYNSLTNYKEVLAEKNQQLDDFMKKDSALLQAIKDKDTKIAELEAKVKELTESGATSSAEVEQLQQQIETLTAQKTALEQEKSTLTQKVADLQAEIQSLEDQAMTQEQYNTLSEKIKGLQAELDKANESAQALDNNTSIDGLTGINSVMSKEDIAGNKDLLLYLTYEYISTNSDQPQALITELNNLKDIDNFRESPIQLYYTGKSSDVRIDGVFKNAKLVYINNANAFNKILEHTNNSNEWYDKGYQSGTYINQIYNTKTNMLIRLLNDTDWTSETGQESDNHNN